MKTKTVVVFGIIVGLAASVSAASSGQAAPPASSTSEKTPAFRFTFTERIRQESADNVTSLNESVADSSAYVRFRTSLQGQWRIFSGFDLTVRLTNENRYYLAPKFDPRIKKNFDGHEIFFDSLNAKWTKPAGLPFTLTVGRQDLQFGEGFLIMDGGPLDGSRSAYFNGIRADWSLDGTNTLTGFYVFQPRSDTLLPVINDWGQKMVEQPEEGFGLYWTGMAGKWNTEGYLFRKNIRAFETSPESQINIVGGRVRAPLTGNLELTTEGAFQFGRLRDLPGPEGNRNRTGLGGYFHLDHKTGAKFPLPARLTLGEIYLSGDDPATTGRYEGWDPAFSRWPKWSESLIYLFGRESKPAFWTNFISLYGTAGFAFAENVNLNLTWHHLRAAAKTFPSAFLSGAGLGRGELFNARLNYEISKNLQGHFVWDYFQPGDYYFAGAQPYSWIRFELLFRY
ncbi:MAG: alginate export family protein [Candidatus Aminicenantes bacterium]|nr:alginate export family protein [Candidatus Aminicenantes bacterium]